MACGRQLGGCMAVSISPLAIPEVRLIVPDRFGDERGFFSETYSRRALADGRHRRTSSSRTTIRCRRRPARCAGCTTSCRRSRRPSWCASSRGAILDVAVDLRRGSPTFGRHVAAMLSADGRNQLFVPVGFAHGFCTLEPDTEVVYKVTAYYSREHDRGIRWDDPGAGDRLAGRSGGGGAVRQGSCAAAAGRRRRRPSCSSWRPIDGAMTRDALDEDHGHRRRRLHRLGLGAACWCASTATRCSTSTS